MFDPAAPMVLGANLPWISYGCDFGASAWRPLGGLASTGVPDHARQALVDLRDGGGRIVRWFLFCDGRSGIRFEGDRPIGIDDRVLADLDVALDLMDATGMQVMFVLFDFSWCRRQRSVNGVRLGGHRRALSRPDLRASLVDHVLGPLFRRYGGRESVAAWDIINEPEWVTFGYGSYNPFATVTRHSMRGFITDVAADARRLTSRPVTVGLASARWLSLVEGLDLDFYQVHWYDRVDGGPPTTAAATLAGGRPVVLGEFPTRGSAHTADVLMHMANGAGYAGALSWSLLADDPASHRPSAIRSLDAGRSSARPVLGRTDHAPPVVGESG